MGPGTSYERFLERVENFKSRRKQIGMRTILPIWTHHWWWMVHNGVAHPLIAVLPVEPAFRFHDYTSDKINGLR